MDPGSPYRLAWARSTLSKNKSDDDIPGFCPSLAKHLRLCPLQLTPKGFPSTRHWLLSECLGQTQPPFSFLTCSTPSIPVTSSSKPPDTGLLSVPLPGVWSEGTGRRHRNPSPHPGEAGCRDHWPSLASFAGSCSVDPEA